MRVGLSGSGEPELLLDVRVREAAGLVATLELIAKCYSDTHGRNPLLYPLLRLRASAHCSPRSCGFPPLAVCIEIMKGQGLQVRAVDQAKVWRTGCWYQYEGGRYLMVTDKPLPVWHITKVEA